MVFAHGERYLIILLMACRVEYPIIARCDRSEKNVNKIEMRGFMAIWLLYSHVRAFGKIQ